MTARYLTAEVLNALKARISAEMTRRSGYGSLVDYADKGDFARRNLPPGYIQLEYIEGTGTQYIDTGFKPNNNTRLILDVELPTQSSYPKALLGGRDGDTSSSKSFVMFIMSASRFRTDFGSKTAGMDMSVTGRFFIDKNRNITVINGTKASIVASTFQSSYNLCLLTETDVGGADTRITAGKIRLCQMYENDIFIRDYIPCLNPQGVAGLYDIVNGVFKGDAAGGEFVAGPVYTNANANKKAFKYQRKAVIDPLLQVNDFATNNILTNNGTDFIVSDLDAAETFITQLELEELNDSSSSCRGACSGLCFGTCFSGCSGCSGTCTEGCSAGCLNTCGANCATGCSSGCSSGCGGCYSCGSACASGCAGCSGGCGGGCSGSCEGCDACSGACQGGCEGCGGCGSACSGCSGCVGCGACGSMCGGSCGGTCGSGCDNGCSSCRGQCLGCSSGASYSGCGCAGCYGSCASGCQTNCYGGCSSCSGCSGCSGCGGCESGCSGCASCSGGCSGGCSASCQRDCTGACSGCTGCSTGCSSACADSCSSTCDSTCYTNCTSTCYGSAN